ncbi:MAG: hypothetical protein WDO15_08905 [Bacteroidota bacterium]
MNNTDERTWISMVMNHTISVNMMNGKLPQKLTSASKRTSTPG